MDQYIQLESDENVFTDIIEKLGTKNVQVSTLEIVDRESLDRFKKIYGAILLFPYTKKHKERASDLCQLDPSAIHGLTFVPQLRNNSCGMMAILHVLLNINDSTVVGPRISSYKDFFDGISSDIRGETIAQQHDLLEINNSYEMHHPITFDIASSSKEDNHYCAFIPFSKVLYQMDGLLSGPVVMDSFDSEAEYRDVLVNALQTRIQEIVTDDPATNSVAILIVHESFLAQYKRELEEEQRLIAQLKGEGEDAAKSGEIAMHEKKVLEILEEIENEGRKTTERQREIEVMRFNPTQFFQEMMKEFMVDAIKKGTYKDIEIEADMYPSNTLQILDSDLDDTFMEEDN